MKNLREEGFLMRSFARYSVVVLLMFGLMGTAWAQEGPTTARAILDGYVQAGLEGNLALKQQEIDLETSLWALNEARGRFLPSVDLQARYSRSGGGRTTDIPVGDLVNPIYGTLNDLLVAQGQTPGFPTVDNEEILFLRRREQDTRLRITQPLYQPRLRHNVRVQEGLLSAQEAGVEAYRHQLIRDIKVSYFNFLKAERAVEIYKATEALVEENERVNARLFQASTVTEDAVFRARAEVLTVAQQTAEAEKDRDLARSYFNFLLNRPLDTSVETIPTDETLFPEIEGFQVQLASLEMGVTPSRLDLQQAALGRRAELRQLDGAVSASQAAVSLARSAYRPGVSFVLDTGIQGERYGFTGERPFYTASLVLQWNLFNGFQTRAQNRQAKLNLQRLRTQREELESQIQLEVQVAHDNVAVGQRALLAATERDRTARKSFRIVSRKYDEGLAAQVTFLDARTTLTNAQLNLNITRTDLLIRLA